MGADDDRDCVEHVWRIVGFNLPLPHQTAGVHTEYRCSRCDAVLLVPPGGIHPPQG